MHVGCRIRPVDGVRANGRTDGTAGRAAVCDPDLQWGSVAVNAQHQHWYTARGDGTRTPTTGTAIGVYYTHRDSLSLTLFLTTGHAAQGYEHNREFQSGTAMFVRTRLFC